MSSTGTCRCCSSISELSEGICAHCIRLHGPRVARLLARCQADAEFKSACLARLPEPTRSRFAAALSLKCLSSAGPGLRYARRAPETLKRRTA